MLLNVEGEIGVLCFSEVTTIEVTAGCLTTSFDIEGCGTVTSSCRARDFSLNLHIRNFGFTTGNSTVEGLSTASAALSTTADFTTTLASFDLNLGWGTASASSSRPGTTSTGRVHSTASDGVVGPWTRSSSSRGGIGDSCNSGSGRNGSDDLLSGRLLLLHELNVHLESGAFDDITEWGLGLNCDLVDISLDWLLGSSREYDVAIFVHLGHFRERLGDGHSIRELAATRGRLHWGDLEGEWCTTHRPSRILLALGGKHKLGRLALINQGDRPVPRRSESVILPFGGDGESVFTGERIIFGLDLPTLYFRVLVRYLLDVLLLLLLFR